MTFGLRIKGVPPNLAFETRSDIYLKARQTASLSLPISPGGRMSRRYACKGMRTHQALSISRDREPI
jgi:hypothetical protein